MALYLVQHGISLAKEIDPQKGLSDKGKTETELIAKVAKGYDITIDTIVHSTKKRAEETAAILHHTLEVNPPLVSRTEIGPLDDVVLFAKGLSAEKKLMVVGHLPFLQRLLSYLVTGDKDTFIYQFQNSGIVCIDCRIEDDGSRNWFIKWTLNPNIS